MGKQLEIEVKVGLFVSIGLGLVMLAILVLGSTENLLSRKTDYYVHFPNVDGLIEGSKVVLGGIQVGTVNQIAFDMEKRDIKVRISVARNAIEWIRADSTVEIATQGVLGDKYVIVTAGSLEQPVQKAGADLPYRPGKGLTQFLNQGDKLMVTLNTAVGTLDRILRTFEANNRSETFFQGISSTSKNLASVTDKLNREMDDLRLKHILKNIDGIMEKINNGQGTLGALINDPGLYDNAKALVGQANRNRLVRNLVRQTIREAEDGAAAADGKKKNDAPSPGKK